MSISLSRGKGSVTRSLAIVSYCRSWPNCLCFSAICFMVQTGWNFNPKIAAWVLKLDGYSCSFTTKVYGQGSFHGVSRCSVIAHCSDTRNQCSFNWKTEICYLPVPSCSRPICVHSWVGCVTHEDIFWKLKSGKFYFPNGRVDYI